MRNLLVVAYYFPPMGLSGVQRVVKLVKYLPLYGWQPVVLTVEPGGYFAYDESLMREVEEAGIEVVRTFSLDPTRLFGRRTVVSLPAESTRSVLSQVSQWVFVPDNKIGWYAPATRAGRRLLASRRFEAIFSSAPPYTGHLISAALARGAGLPFLADFRDDWLGNPRHIYPTRLHRRMHERLERRVLKESSATLTINRCIAASLEARMPPEALNPVVTILPQGFDAEDFNVAPAPRKAGVMRLVHAGIFYDRQTPDVFLKALAELLRRRPEARDGLEAVFVGLMPESSTTLARELGLDGIVIHAGYVPHVEVPSYLLSADVLWMTIGRQPGAECISTGKLYEYFGSRKPILALVPPGVAAEDLDRYGAARVVDPEDVAAASRSLEQFYDLWRAGSLPQPHPEHVEKFDRRALASIVADLCTKVAATKTHCPDPTGNP